MRTKTSAMLAGLAWGTTLLCHQAWGDVAPKGPSTPPAQQAVVPWLTGPLLTPSGHVVPKGHINIEPYEYVTINYGAYDSKWNAHSTPKFYSLQTQVPVQYGFAKNFDFQVIPNFFWKHTEGASHWDFGDADVLLDYQLVNDKPKKWWPAVRLSVGVNVPFGKYQKLKASSKGTDIGGIGSWQPLAALTFAHLYTFRAPHFLSARAYFAYNPTVPVHVKGLNAYGGGKGTRGTVYPGNIYTGLIGLEYTLTQRWALALDIQYTHSNKTRFKGHTRAPVGSPSSEQLGFAPAIEYNWSPYVGMIAGCWFSAAGRNATEFASAIVAVNIYK